MSKFEIRELRKSDIPQLENFAPAEWNSRMDLFCEFHWGKDYFLPLVMVNKGEIIANAHAIFSGNVGWAANIIVKPSYYKQGLGFQITEFLIEKMLKRVPSLVLIATQMGEGLYAKFGFETVENYHFFDYKQTKASKQEQIIPYQQEFFKDIFELFYETTSEDRKTIIEPHLKNCWVFKAKNSNIEGFYIEGFGDGTVIAKSEEAGKKLLNFKHSRGEYRSVVPGSNLTAIERLKSLGFTDKSQAKRMHLGKEIHWKPQQTYCRIAGYFG